LDIHQSVEDPCRALVVVTEITLHGIDWDENARMKYSM